MKRLVVSALGNRIYDAVMSKTDSSKMTDQRTDRTKEVESAFIQYLANQIPRESSGVKLDYGDYVLTLMKKRK